MSQPITSCKSCHAPIEWVRTTKGKRMPLDANPTPDGNIVKDHETASPDGMVTVVVYLRRGETSAKPRYTSHFATCPDAGDWRKR